MEILRAEHLTKIYGKGNTSVTAVNDLSLSVAQGEFVAVVGSSGSGKSTLLHMLGGVQKFPFIKDERITNRQINDLMERSPYRFYENWGLIRFERMDIGQSAYHMLYLAVAVTNVIILAAAVSCIGSSFAISMEESGRRHMW